MKTDSWRVKITKRILNESLIQCLKEKPLDKITIKEICERAEINRSTYYRYFQNPFDQLGSIERNLISDMEVYVSQITNGLPDMENESREYCMLRYLEFMDSRREIIRLLIQHMTGMQFVLDIVRFFQEQIILDKPKRGKEQEKLYAYLFASTGCMGLLYHWMAEENNLDIKTLARLMLRYTDYFR